MKNNAILATTVAIAVIATAVVGLVASRAIFATDTAPSRPVVIEQVEAPANTIPAVSLPAMPTPELDDQIEPEQVLEATVPALVPVRDIETEIALFISSFSEAHTNGDLSYLLETLHPSIYEAFGEQACIDYTEATIGSITDMTSLGAGPELPFTLPAGAEQLTFEHSYSVAAQWTETPTDTTNVVTFHVVDTDGTLAWLTTCGIKAVDA